MKGILARKHEGAVHRIDRFRGEIDKHEQVPHDVSLHTCKDLNE